MGPRFLARTSEWPSSNIQVRRVKWPIGSSQSSIHRGLDGGSRCLRPEVRAITCSSFFSLADLWEGLALSAFFELSASHILAGKVRPLGFPACGSGLAVPILHQ